MSLALSFYYSYIQNSAQLLKGYTGHEPFNSYLKRHFSLHKKFGSKDRKRISHACYCYFRLGKSLDIANTEDKIKAGLFLCSDQPGEWASLFNSDWLVNWSEVLEERFDFLQQVYPVFNRSLIFPLYQHVSEGIDAGHFSKSHVIQPELFLRVRPGRKDKTLEQLQQHNIAYHELSESCIALKNASKLDNVIDLNKDAVVQDYNSQQVGKFFETIIKERGIAPLRAWDCCAASGGKSILAYDLFPSILLSVSDVRTSILHNLQQRFAAAGLNRYEWFVADATKPVEQAKQYDLVICDAPCSGSGTWGRTPEHLVFFEEDRIQQYANLQQKILTNVMPHVQPGGYLLYITCSVFREENEAAVDFINKNNKFQLVQQEILKGYCKKADSMFAALFRQL